MSQKLKHELKAVALAMVYFGSWIAALLLLKQLVLAEYRIAFHDWTLVLVGALILSKVVLVLEHVPLGAWVQGRPAWVDVAVRTVLYAAGVAMVMALEKAFEGRHEHGGFMASLTAGLEQADAHHILANTICLSGALFSYNALAVVRRHLGHGGLLRLFATPLPNATARDAPRSSE